MPRKGASDHPLSRREVLAGSLGLALAIAVFPKKLRAAHPRVMAASSMRMYVCTMCGYIYDPRQGDPSSQIRSGTPFERLPTSWVCPVCGADKSAFEAL